MEKKRTDRSVRRPGKKYVGVDLDEAVYEQLDQIAKADRRPLASMIRLILDQYLSVYNSGETLMPMRRVIGQLPMKRDSEDHMRADLRESGLNMQAREPESRTDTRRSQLERFRNVAKQQIDDEDK
jgi:hypothetical protein